MPLPPHAPVSEEMIVAVCRHHGLGVCRIQRLPDTGIFNAVYFLAGEYVLRIPRQHHAHERALLNESIAVPIARRAGVRTPALIAYDDSRTLVPVPYTIYERVHGETLEHRGLEPEEVPRVWRELGHDLARLHASVERSALGEALADQETLQDPRELAEILASGGWMTRSEARWLVSWLDRLAPDALAAVDRRLLHGDTQTSNTMVSTSPPQYTAVLDWGSAGWGDPAWDFAGVPLRAVPYLLNGYRMGGTSGATDTIEPRILWRHIQLALFTARRGAQPGRSWAERPLSMLVEIARFFLGDPPQPWNNLRPPAAGLL